ncbi:sporulation-delaying protein SdpB family protein [Halpernia frigidisoli]|uniref:Antimicrobial peptide system protein, SdpB family n=1 Tax=Halpernia frigidisoli TaxID=1125876 RepID=A0A1I3IH37_9FLAO|nr:sporulation-delaying protein SdpB family protein [Halpernia frigidisoli]SFI47304.1 antimicrobial peptide system protein, SdpB family [Halpernia frigidisoli]
MKVSLNAYNICRTSLAIGTLLTLISNSNYTLFGNNPPEVSFTYYNASLFFILGNTILAKFFAIMVLLFVISGFYPKFSGILHWYVTYSFLISCDVFDGGDQIASNLTLLLLPLTVLDKSQNHWNSNGITFNSNYFLKLIQKIFYNLILVQICVIYLHAFVGKLAIEEWSNGTAAYYWLTHKYFGIAEPFRNFAQHFLANEYITTIITWGTILLEFILASFIFVSQNDKRRIVLFIVATIFHFNILIFHGLASFFFMMLAASSIYLIPLNKNYNLNFTLWQKISKTF